MQARLWSYYFERRGTELLELEDCGDEVALGEANGVWPAHPPLPSYSSKKELSMGWGRAVHGGDEPGEEAEFLLWYPWVCNCTRD